MNNTETIYVLDLIYIQKENESYYENEEFLDNQIHFLSLDKAKEYAETWLNNHKNNVNLNNVKGLLAVICTNNIINLTEEEHANLITGIEQCGYYDYAEFTNSTIIYHKEIDFIKEK